MGADRLRIPAEARAANEEACAHIAERRFVEAIPDALTATRAAPRWATAWLNLVVALKHARRWAELVEASDHALALGIDDDAREGLAWNTGIAATALGDWSRARIEWTRAGVGIPPGEGPIEMRLGLTPIRIVPDGDAEVVWCDRIDPCRASITSIPLPTSGHRHRDLVLHDGEPRGERRLGDQTVSVFDELALLERSRYQTWQAIVRLDGPDQLDETMDRLEHRGVQAEDWTASIEVLCAKCSLGLPHHHDEHERGWQPERRLALAVVDEDALAPVRALPQLVALRCLLPAAD